ncbi:AraC family transcriptional regulator [Bombilactobacillus thymidiniphilus]|uniref:AraC family transcriptional regulator n=1 Tax=Bombilactobacillus thymidiniphilus TaxID=2923363 RepID=A0ABY4PCH7_9LACO|nr:AraC family transcriptional regulator [Bombilactobacillus thymidiniphilus]UQS83396.1 AraC family transcriptional regulator [Bombilactobacillus thymidiniphilus]
MKKELQELLRKNNYPRDWQQIARAFTQQGNPLAQTVTNIDEPVYNFFETYSDNLVLNLQPITISAQPVCSYIPYHMHNYIEVMIPLVGECSVYFEKQTLNLKSEDILLIGSKTAHKVKPIGKNDIVINIMLKQAAFSLSDLNFLQNNSGGASIFQLLLSLFASEKYSEERYVWFKINHQQKIVNNIYDIIDEYYHSDIQSQQILHFDILTLFSRLLRQSYYSKIYAPQSNHSQINLLALLLYIESHYKTITLDNLAQHFGFNPNYLSTYLKKETGHTFIQLVHLQRINVAAQLLLYTDASVETIATEVGYENPSYLYKIFKKIFGISPATYRKTR